MAASRLCPHQEDCVFSSRCSRSLNFPVGATGSASPLIWLGPASCLCRLQFGGYILATQLNSTQFLFSKVMPARTKRASVSEDGTPINRRVPTVFATESSSSEEETETESDAGAQEDIIRMNRNPNRKGKVSSVQLRDDLLSMLVAGHETTGSVLI